MKTKYQNLDIVKLTGPGWEKYRDADTREVPLYGVVSSKVRDKGDSLLVCPIDSRGHVTWWGTRVEELDSEEFKIETTGKKALERATVTVGNIVIVKEK